MSERSEKVRQVEDYIIANPRIPLPYVAEDFGLSVQRVWQIRQRLLGEKRLSPRSIRRRIRKRNRQEV